MKFIVCENLPKDQMEYLLIIPNSDASRAAPMTGEDRQFLEWCGGNQDIESKLMGLQIIVRNIECAERITHD